MLPFLNAYGAKTVAMAMCIKKAREWFLKIDSNLIFLIVLFSLGGGGEP